MPRNGKESILFSFIMSVIMIYVMAALNYGVRAGNVGTASWSYALFNWPLAYVISIICDLCTNLHRLRLVSGSQGSSSTG